jgi:hypothetical protein
MGLWEEQPSSSFSFKGLELDNESPPFKWEWFSEPLDYPPDERCSPESMVGTMSPLEGSPRPFQGGEEVRIIYSIYRNSRGLFRTMTFIALQNF